MAAVNKRISTVSLLVITLFVGRADAANLDNYCEEYAQRGFRSVDICRESEKHYQGQARRLKTWATSDEWASCEQRSSSYRFMAQCVQRKLGSRGPGIEPWSPPPSAPSGSSINQPRPQSRQSSSSATMPPPSEVLSRDQLNRQSAGSLSSGRGPVSMGIPTPSSATFQGAAQAGDVASLEAYLAGGQDIDAPLLDGKTALHFAAMWGREEAVEFLLSQGADHRKADDFGRKPVFYAKDRRYREIEQLLNDAARR